MKPETWARGKHYTIWAFSVCYVAFVAFVYVKEVAIKKPTIQEQSSNTERRDKECSFQLQGELTNENDKKRVAEVLLQFRSKNSQNLAFLSLSNAVSNLSLPHFVFIAREHLAAYGVLLYWLSMGKFAPRRSVFIFSVQRCTLCRWSELSFFCNSKLCYGP